MLHAAATSTADGAAPVERIAIVTGAAGGIGAAIVRRLLARGVCVVALDLDGSRLGDVCGPPSARLHPLVVDVTDPGAVDQAADDVATALGCASILVCCAGAFARTPALQPGSAASRLLAVNLESAVHCTRAFGAQMAKRGGGRIVHVASIAATTGAATASVYAASKAGLVALARSHARELAPQGIAVNAVLPGYCRTAMTARDAATLEAFVVPRIPLKRLAEPDEIAEVVEMLATCSTPYLTGAAIEIDGGLHVG
jgi:NAD(P)-dependent dehydrogenase (short-subunit alcohol dehydrogenase family)